VKEVEEKNLLPVKERSCGNSSVSVASRLPESEFRTPNLASDECRLEIEISFMAKELDAFLIAGVSIRKPVIGEW
jgi:hypothetical protein